MASRKVAHSGPGSLARNQIHIWRAILNQSPDMIGELEQTLAPDERIRADRFHFQDDRERFIVGRGFLRCILGCYLGQKPAEVRLRCNAHGKPSLVQLNGDEPLCFNMSHSNDLALYGLARGREIGVDVEKVRQDLDEEAIIDRFFSPGEIAAWQAVPRQLRKEAFFTCWARKEAYLKATGKGLTIPLDQFEVSLAPGEPARLKSTWHDPADAKRWCLHELNPGAGYAGAIAIERCPCDLWCGDWNGEGSELRALIQP